MTREHFTKPQFNGRSIDQYLRDLGIDITPKTDGDIEDKCSIRIGMNHAIYGFKSIDDAEQLTKTLEAEDISYAIPAISTGARYSYHVVLEIEPSRISANAMPRFIPDTTNKTNYTPQSIQDALYLVKQLKNITVRSQDYHTSSYLREIEKSFSDKIEQDKNRRL